VLLCLLLFLGYIFLRNGKQSTTETNIEKKVIEKEETKAVINKKEIKDEKEIKMEKFTEDENFLKLLKVNILPLTLIDR
jgi:hypothetical protein